MLKLRKLIPALVAGFVTVLASCSAETAATLLGKGPCDAEAAQSLVGKPKPTDVEAMQVTKATTVRQIEPGQPVTQDFRDDRVTIETDPGSGQVVAARCG
ncbi:MAG: I78 family peptidase inhibitor [Pseudorhizobium sp.]